MKNNQKTNPRFYITNLHELEDQSCSLCFQFSLQMKKCSNSCQKNICVLCLRSRQNLRQCPICYQNLQIQNPTPPVVKFACPSRNQSCLVQLIGLQQFLSHASQCTLIDGQLLKQFQYKTSFKCKDGHPLQYDDQQKCCECGLFGSTSQCQECEKYYCTICRPLPCNKLRCMKGHPFRKQKVTDYDVVCDLCELEINSLNIRQSYADNHCDIDVCVFCYEKIPSGEKINKKKSKKKNI